MPKFIDLTGQRFGRLLVLEEAPRIKGTPISWVCQCDCGKKKIVQSGNLRNGSSTSCGCYQREQVSKAVKTHGGKGSRLYVVWRSMRDRCENQNKSYYKYYGGKGIAVCDEWHDFSKFRDWALANGYDENAKYGECTIDRINNDENYSPDNCRWVSMKEQAKNRRQRKG